MKKLFFLTGIIAVNAAAIAQNVGIGTNTPAAILDVNAPSILATKFNGPNQMFLGFYESNVQRGYLGSFAGATEDFDIGTSSNNTNGKLHFTIQASPKMTIDVNGSVGIGIASPSPSALLDMNSVTRGLLIPRMTSVQRSAIPSPANGLMVYDITTSTIWFYNGTAWTEMSGGGLTLPYAGTNASPESFKVTNTASGGTAIYGRATSTNASFGILGEGSGGSSIGVRAKNTTGFAIYADATPAAVLTPVIKGMSNSATQGVGVMGESNGANGRGLYGVSLAGIGVEGYGNDAAAIGVKGNSLAGIGVKAYSFSGTALDVEGNIKIAGGNTNPAAGAVLTSDASGNATWQMPVQTTPKVGFRCYGVSTTVTSGVPNNEIPLDTYKKVEFQTESHDTHGDFIVTGNGLALPLSSTFTVPFNGVHHFDFSVKWEDAILFDFFGIYARLMMKRGASVTVIAENYTGIETKFPPVLSISTDQSLLAGDVIWVEVKQVNQSFTSSDLETSGARTFFSGHLVYLQ